MPAATFRDLADILGPAQPIELPIRGKVYAFPGSVSGRTGLLLSTAVDAAVTARTAGDGDAPAEPGELDSELVELLTDEQEDSIRGEVFGGVDRDMIRDGCDSRELRHVWLTLLVWHAVGPEAAQAAWESVGNGQAPAPNRGARRAASRTGSGAAASRTRKPASGSGTRATSRAKVGTGSRTSSAAGR